MSNRMMCRRCYLVMEEKHVCRCRYCNELIEDGPHACSKTRPMHFIICRKPIEVRMNIVMPLCSNECSLLYHIRLFPTEWSV